MATDDKPDESPESAPDQRDDALLEQLQATINTFDPVPNNLVDMAKGAYAWRTIDRELAELQSDSLADDGAGVRSTDAIVRLSFKTKDATIDVEVGPEGLIGQVTPPALAVQLIFESGVDVEASCDAAGQFSLMPASSGPARLTAHMPGERGDLTTEWFTV